MGAFIVLDEIKARELESKGYKCFKRDKVGGQTAYYFHETDDIKAVIKSSFSPIKDYVSIDTVNF